MGKSTLIRFLPGSEVPQFLLTVANCDPVVQGKLNRCFWLLFVILKSVSVPNFNASPTFSNFFASIPWFQLHTGDHYRVTTTRMETSFGFLDPLMMLLTADLSALSSIDSLNCRIMNNGDVNVKFSEFWKKRWISTAHCGFEVSSQSKYTMIWPNIEARGSISWQRRKLVHNVSDRV
jgi:hypothetical protein